MAGFPSSWYWQGTSWAETSPGTRLLTGLYGYSSRTCSGTCCTCSFFPATAVGSEPHDVPPIGPSWFLRDIIILTLLTPLLARIKILLLPALLLFFSFCNMAPDPLVTLSVGSCAFYLPGVVLSSRRIDDIHLVLNKKFGIVFCASILVSSAMVLLHSAGILSLWTETVAGMLLGVMLIMYAGIWMEKRLPGVAARIALLAPACFLTFMLHMPIYKCLPPSMKFGAFALFTPLLTFTAIVLFYVALKRFAPFLLPYWPMLNGRQESRRKGQMPH